MDNINPEELLRDYSQEGQQSSEDDPEIEVRGKKYKASQIAQYEQGFMRQEDYTRKTQELAQQRQQQQAQLQELEQLKQYIGVIQQRDPYFMAQAQRILQGQPADDPYAGDPYMQQIRQQQAMIQNLSNWQQELSRKQHENELEKELTALEEKYPKMDRNYVLSLVAADPTVDTAEAARVSHEGMTQRIRRELETMAEQRHQQRKAMTEGIGGRTAGITKPTKFPQTREELDKAVTERLRILNGG
jgi:hypothetical protein